MIDAALLAIVKAVCLLLMLATLGFRAAFWLAWTPAAAFAELLWLLQQKDAP